VKQQLSLLDELKSEFLIQLKCFMELAERKITEDVIAKVQYTSKCQELKVGETIIFLL